MYMRIYFIAACFAFAASASAASAAQPAIGDADMHAAAASLRPGQSAWRDGAWQEAPSAVVVSLALQRIYLYRGDALVGVASISTGRRGKATPVGHYPILQKARWHRSNLYSNAPMPFMQRLTWDGIALHAGVNPGYPASHGCVRLPTAFARDLFGLTELGTPVTVADYPGQLPILLVAQLDGEKTPTEPMLAYTWAAL